MTSAESLFDRLAERTAARVGDRVAPPALALRDPVHPGMSKRDAVVWRLQRSTRGAVGVDRQRALLSALDAAPAQARATQAALLVWIDSVARLVQAAEDRHAGERGAGEAKLAEVCADVAKAIGCEQAPFDGIPRAAGPWISAAVTPWLAEALVFLANRYSLWRPLAPDRGTRRAERARAVALAGLRLLGRIVSFALVTLSRPLQRSAGALERTGSRLAGRGQKSSPPPVEVSTRPALEPLLAAAAWIGREREHLIPAIDLVASSIALAESELDMSERKRVAQAVDLVLLVVEDMGLDTRAPLTRAMSEAVASVAVTAVRRHLRAGSLVVDDPPAATERER